MKENIIEGYLWSDVFTQDIIHFTLPFLGLLAVCKVISMFPKLKQLKAFAHMIKLGAYGYVVGMLLAFFYKNENAVYSINVFTGFTFLFSALEVVDNFFMGIEELRCSNWVKSNYDNEALIKQEKDFMKMHSILINMRSSIMAGRANTRMKENIMKFWDASCEMQFYHIDSILKDIENGEYNFSSSIVKLQINEVIKAVYIKEDKEKRGKKSKALSFSKQQCDELIELLDAIIKINEIYYNERERLRRVGDNMKKIIQ